MTGHDWKILPEPFRSTFKSRNRLFFLLKAIIVETGSLFDRNIYRNNLLAY